MSKIYKNMHLNHLTLKTQLECISISAELLHSANNSSFFMQFIHVTKHNYSSIQHTVIRLESSFKGCFNTKWTNRNSCPFNTEAFLHEYSENSPFKNIFLLFFSEPWVLNSAKANRTMTVQADKSIICNKPPLTAVHAGIVTTPPLIFQVLSKIILSTATAFSMILATLAPHIQDVWYQFLWWDHAYMYIGLECLVFLRQ